MGLGQNILGWAAVVADILTWIAAYLVKKKDNSDAVSTQVSKQIYINGDVVNSNLNIGDNNQLIISKDENGNTKYQESISNANLYLERVKKEFDKENVNLVGNLLENVKEIILKLGMRIYL